MTPNGADYPVCVHCAANSNDYVGMNAYQNDTGMPSKPGGDDRWDTPHSIIDRSISGEIPLELDERVDYEECSLPALPGPEWFPDVTDESRDFGTHRPNENLPIWCAMVTLNLSPKDP
eukprot:4464056-Amphidinium_carterae.1